MAKQESKTQVLSDDEQEKYRKQSLGRLMEAKETADVLKWAAIFGWFDDGNKTLCPKAAIPTCGQIVEWLPSAPDSAGKTLVDFIHCFQVWCLLSERESGEQLTPLMVLERFSHFMDFSSLKNDIDEDSAVIIFEQLHAAWLPLYNATDEEKAAVEDARKIFFNIPFPPIHPLCSLVAAWQNRPTEIEATTIYDARRPAAIMRFPRSSFTVELFSDSSPTGSLKRFADDSLLPQSIQMILPGIQRKSVIRDPSKMLLTQVAGVPTTTRKGAVSPEVRVCVEAIMQMPPKERVIQVHVVLGDLIERLYLNGFNWTNQAPNLIESIKNIDNLTVPFVNTSGKFQRGWAPVMLNTRELSRRDDDVVFTVSLPVDATAGPMVEKYFVRMLGLISAPKWQAYFSLCDLFHRYGVKKGKGGFYLVDPTKPVERRNSKGYLLNAQYQVIYGTNGEPLIDPYDSEAVKQLDREPNQKGIDEYPIVPFEDMVKAPFPGRVYKNASEKAIYLGRAKDHFRELADKPSKAFGEKKGEKKAPHIIKINEEHSDGWQFLPGESHVAVYRGVSTGGE